MKLVDAIRNVTHPADPYGRAYDAPIEVMSNVLLSQELFQWPESLDRRLRAFPIFHWICTDTLAGMEAYFLDGEPVGCGYRASRKSMLRIRWLSKEHAERVRAVLLEHMDKPAYDILDPDEDIPDTFSVQFAGQAPTDDGFHQGEPARALVWYDGLTGRTTRAREGHSHIEAVAGNDPRAEHVLIQVGDSQRLVPNAEFHMPIRVKKSD